MASQQTMEAAARESRANAREDMAVLTSGAREKVDRTMASAQALGQQLLHPFDKHKRAEAHSQAEENKQSAAEKRDEIRAIATQQAQQERIAARAQVAETMRAPEGAGSRYPSTVLKPESTLGSNIAVTANSTSSTRLQHHPVVEQVDGATASTAPAHPTSAVTTRIPRLSASAQDLHEHRLDRTHEFKEPTSAEEAGRPHDEHHLDRIHDFKEPEHAQYGVSAPTPTVASSIPPDQAISRGCAASHTQAPQTEDVLADTDFYHTVELVDTRPSV